MFSSPQQVGYQKPYASMYREVGASTLVDGASPHKLVSLLYQQLASEIAAARGALARRDIPVKCKAIGKAVKIIEEGLNAPLDLEAGGGLAINLRHLYEYMVRRLTLANASGDDAALAECARLTETLRDGWDRIADQVATTSAAA